MVCPSLIDAAPGVLFEAAALGANPVASHNCGNADVCHADLLVQEYSAQEFAQCVRRALVRKYEDGLAACLSSASYEDLVSTLDAFGTPFESRGAA